MNLKRQGFWDGRRFIALLAMLLAVAAIVFVVRDLLGPSSISGGNLAGAGSERATGSPSEATYSAQLQAIDDRLNKLTRQLSQAPPAETDQPASEKIKFLEDQIAELMARSDREDAERQVSRANAAELQEAANDPHLRQQFARAIQQQEERQAEIVEESFGQESVDTGWAVEAAERIEGSLAASDAFYFAKVLDLQCRTTMCRVDLSVPQSGVVQRQGDGQTVSGAEALEVDLAVLAAVSSEMPMGSMRREPDGSGGYTYRFYLHREGYLPPKAPNPMKSMTVAEMRAYLENL
ncbi:hypothetical protein [Thiocapsa bogorovii]|uniref:hypothetical protein n=1 Tax=Thiocapsa bogorovii TaxID=521689 RepID=UPI001E2BFFC7|nr:hypothetical protein [Thiocapsa bogorovii]UHD14707.1 hypothetical protein LT988_15605 [Thiocapsa bogorovii]